MATRKLSASFRTTAPARATCRCPLCSGDTIGAEGIYPCRADVKVEYLVFVAGEFRAARPNYLMAETELNQARREALTAPVELAAAEADLDAEIESECAFNRATLAESYGLAGEIEVCTVCGQVDPVGTGCQNCPVTPPAEILPFTPDNSPLDPRPTPPAISYSAAWGGFSWVGAPRVDGRPVAYSTFTEADTARAAWLKVRRSPRDARAVRDQLAARGLTRAAA